MQQPELGFPIHVFISGAGWRPILLNANDRFDRRLSYWYRLNCMQNMYLPTLFQYLVLSTSALKRPSMSQLLASIAQSDMKLVEKPRCWTLGTRTKNRVYLLVVALPLLAALLSQLLHLLEEPLCAAVIQDRDGAHLLAAAKNLQQGSRPHETGARKAKHLACSNLATRRGSAHICLWHSS